MFTAYRYLATAPGVRGVWHQDGHYSQTPGYYYLHRKVPFYDYSTGKLFQDKLATLQASVSHIVTANSGLAIPGYSVAKTFGDIRVLQRDSDEPAVRQWREHVPYSVNPNVTQVLHKHGISNRVPPPNWGIRFVE